MAKKEIDLSVPKDLTPEEKAESLHSTIAMLDRKYGSGAVMKLGEKAAENVPVISSGSLGLDVALGVGGIPKGRITELYGAEGSGKTTIALHILAETQKQGGTAAFIDAEHALDARYASQLGVNLDDLLVSQPDCGEDALDICEKLCRSGAVDAIVIDSVAALTPRSEILGQMGDQSVGLQARMMGQAMRKLSGVVAKSECIVVFINQVRDNIGNPYAPSKTTPGGNALKFFSSVRIEVYRASKIKEGANDDVVGNKVVATVVKNKVAPPFRAASFEILFGKGINRDGEIFDYATKVNIVKKSGSWFSYGGEKIAQGRNNAIEYLKDNPEKWADVCNKVNEEIGNGKTDIIDEVPPRDGEEGDEDEVSDSMDLL